MVKNIVRKIDDRVFVRNCIISVSDKAGIEKLVHSLVKLCPGLKIYSTGGTFSKLEEVLEEKGRGRLIPISEYTGQPEMQGGLVKTLDFKIYLGLLSETYNQAHQDDIKRVSGVNFDLVVVNLYPFKETISKEGVSPEEARANIDIGGPCMIRASAKNFIRVAVLVSPDDYEALIRELKENQGATRLKFRYEMARKAFEHTASYDRAISDYLSRTSYEEIEKAYPEIVN